MPARWGAQLLTEVGFTCHRVTFSDPGIADVGNLYARIGTGGHISFAGAPTWCRRAMRSAWSIGAFSGEGEGRLSAQTAARST